MVPKRALRQLLDAQSPGFHTIKRVGSKIVNEIENVLVIFIQACSIMTDEEIVKLTEHGFHNHSENERSFLINLDPHLDINLLDVLVPFSKALLESFGYTREFEVLKRRYGLNNSKEYTLQEIGDYYDLTRERVRQLEFRAIQKIKGSMLGLIRSNKWKVPSAIIDEANNLCTLLNSTGTLLVEQEIIRIVENRYEYDIPKKELGLVKFLVSVLGLESLPKNIPGRACDIHYCWLTDKIDKPLLYQTLKALRGLLINSALPLSFFDLKIEINRKRKNKIGATYIHMAIKAYKEIESSDEEYYQLKFEYLPSLADKAFRVLYEAKQPLHLRDISRQINHRLAKVGSVANVAVRSIQSQIVSDSRFACIGSSGIWSLAEWINISRHNIVDLMKEFFHVKQSSATIDEVYQYVHSKRSDVAKQSIAIYLSMRIDTFTRTSKREYELTVWGKKAFMPNRKNSSQKVQEKLNLGVKNIFVDQLKTLPLSDLIRRLAHDTGLSVPTISHWLSSSSSVKIETYRAGKQRKRAIYIENHKGLIYDESIVKATIRARLGTIRLLPFVEFSDADTACFVRHGDAVSGASVAWN